MPNCDTTTLARASAVLGRLGFLAKFGGPSFLDRLPPAPEGERVGGHVLGDHRARPDIGVGADRDGRHERAVGADERSLADRDPLIIVSASVGAGLLLGPLRS